jgi:hypothetical protein
MVRKSERRQFYLFEALGKNSLLGKTPMDSSETGEIRSDCASLRQTGRYAGSACVARIQSVRRYAALPALPPSGTGKQFRALALFEPTLP